MYWKWIFILLALTVTKCSVFCQNSFFTRADCLNHISIRLPLDNSDFSVSSTVMELSGEPNIIYYSKDDNYTFWYKITSDKKQLLQFEVESSDETDLYDYFLYKYDSTYLCEAVVKGITKPLPVEQYLASNTADLLPLYSNAIVLEPHSTYYLSVFSISGQDCGHRLTMQAADETVVINAIHNPCYKMPEPMLASTTEPIRVEETKPPLISLTGYIKDKESGNNLQGIIEFKDATTEEQFTTCTNEAAMFKTDIAKSTTLSFTCTSFGYKPAKGQIDIKESSSFNIYLSPMKKGDNIVLDNIYFHPNTYAFVNDSADGLDKLYQFMINNPAVIIDIGGHTAGSTFVRESNPMFRGLGSEWNYTGSSKKLSKHRAEEVKRYLTKGGIEPQRINTKGYGDTRKLIDYPVTQAERSLNMRVEVTIQ